MAERVVGRAPAIL